MDVIVYPVLDFIEDEYQYYIPQEMRPTDFIEWLE